MCRQFVTRLAAALFTVLAAAGTASAAPLTAKQRKVFDYLVGNWGKDTEVTGIDLMRFA